MVDANQAGRLVILGTGGTIAGRAARAADNVGYVAGQVGVADLVAAVRRMRVFLALRGRRLWAISPMNVPLAAPINIAFGAETREETYGVDAGDPASYAIGPGAAAGVDASNTDEGTVLLLPLDPDASAREIAAVLQLTSVLGIHTMSLAAPILEEELAHAHIRSGGNGAASHTLPTN